MDLGGRLRWEPRCQRGGTACLCHPGDVESGGCHLASTCGVPACAQHYKHDPGSPQQSPEASTGILLCRQGSCGLNKCSDRSGHTAGEGQSQDAIAGLLTPKLGL